MLLTAMPAVVGLVSWIIYWRMTRRHKGVQNSATKFIALAQYAGHMDWFHILVLSSSRACCLLKARLPALKACAILSVSICVHLWLKLIP